jgi:hypothetical protein
MIHNDRMIEDMFLRVNGRKQRVEKLEDQVQVFRNNKDLYDPAQE